MNEDEDFQQAARMILISILLAVGMFCFTAVMIVWLLTK